MSVRGKPYRSWRQLLLTGLALVLVPGVMGAGSAAAHTFTRNDANDSPGRLDIRNASVGHKNNSVVHTVRTYEGWTPKSLGNDSFIVVLIDKNRDNDFELCANILFASGRLRGSLTNCGRTFVRTLPVSKPSKATARITIPTGNLGIAYRWVVFSYWRGLPSRCSDLCFDAAPNRPPPIRHDLAPPVVTMPSTDPIRVWEGTDGTDSSFAFPFTLNDPGGSSGSGVATWKVQRRPIESSPWTDTGVSGTGGGAKNPTIPGVEGTRAHYRVVATDKHGNKRIGPARPVYIPADDDDLEPLDFSAAPTPFPDATAFGASYSQMAASDIFTYTFSPIGADCTFELIGPGGGTWTIEVSADGGLAQDVADSDVPDLPRQVIYSDASCATTYVVTITAGTFGLDAVFGS